MAMEAKHKNIASFNQISKNNHQNYRIRSSSYNGSQFCTRNLPEIIRKWAQNATQSKIFTSSMNEILYGVSSVKP